jgi:thioredoxin 2
MTQAQTRSGAATVRCPFCGKLNRVNLTRLAEGPRCGECTRPFHFDRPLHATGEDFDETIRTATVPVVVDFYADWCGPCRAMAPLLDELAAQRAGELLVLKVDTDRDPALASRLGIRGIPTVIGFRDGQEVKRHVGMAPRATLEALAESP